MKITDYFLVIEQDPHDPQSDLLAVRREGGVMFSGEKPDGADELWHGVEYTCVDRIPRAGNSAGKVVATEKWAGWVKLTYKQIRGNQLAEWIKPYSATPTRGRT